jgi:hypothetical protein
MLEKEPLWSGLCSILLKHCSWENYVIPICSSIAVFLPINPLYYRSNSLLRLCNSTFQSLLSMIYLCYLLFSFEQGVENSVYATLLFNPFCLSFCSHFILVDRKLRKTWNSKCGIKCVNDIYIEFRIPLWTFTWQIDAKIFMATSVFF